MMEMELSVAGLGKQARQLVSRDVVLKHLLVSKGMIGTLIVRMVIHLILPYFICLSFDHGRTQLIDIR